MTQPARRSRRLGQNIPPKKSKITARVHKHFKAILVFSGALIGVATGTITLINMLRKHAPDIVMENVIPEQRPIKHTNNDAGITRFAWEGAFSISNLEKETVALRSVSPIFKPIEHDGHVWELKEDGSLLYAQEFDSEAAIHDHYLALQIGREDEKRERAPFLLKAGEKKYFIFDLDLVLYRDGDPCGRCVIQNESEFTAYLVGNPLDTDGTPRCSGRIIPFRLDLNAGEQLTVPVETWIAFNGCTVYIPRIAGVYDPPGNDDHGIYTYGEEGHGPLCEVTKPSKDGIYRNDWIAVELPPDGIVELHKDHHHQDAQDLIPFPLRWRVLKHGSLEISGKRLDAEAPPLWVQNATVDDKQQTRLTQIVFPKDGCWEMTARVADHELKLVTQVVGQTRVKQF